MSRILNQSSRFYLARAKYFDKLHAMMLTRFFQYFGMLVRATGHAPTALYGPEKRMSVPRGIRRIPLANLVVKQGVRLPEPILTLRLMPISGQESVSMLLWLWQDKIIFCVKNKTFGHRIVKTPWRTGWRQSFRYWVIPLDKLK